MEPRVRTTKSKAVHNISTASANVRGGESNTSQQRINLNERSGSHTYTSDKVVGNGTFGVVYQATIAETGEKVAIKKVFQDKRYKNREYEIMKELTNQNVVGLRHAFYTSGDKPDEVFLNLVMEFFPDTLYRVVKNYSRMRATHSAADSEAVQLPDPAFSGLYPRDGRVPQRHKAAEPPGGPRHAQAGSVRLRLCEKTGAWRAERRLYLFAVLPCTRTDFWGDGL